MDASGDQQTILRRYREGPAMLEEALAGLGDADLDAPPATGGWTIRQIAHHVVDGDDLWKICVKAALGNDQGEFTLAWYWSVPQEAWAERWAYAHRSLDVSLALFRANRDHILQLLAAVPDGWDRSLAFRKRDGQITRLSVGFVMEMQADHVAHHVKRIRALRHERESA